MTQTFELRPLGIGEILDRAIRLYRHKFLDFIGIIAIVQVPLAVLQLLLAVISNASLFRAEGPLLPQQYEEIFPNLIAGVGGGILVGILSLFILQGVATAAMTRAIADIYLGRDTSIIEAYRRVGSSWKSLVGALLLAALIIIGLAILLIIPCLGWVAAIGPLLFISWCVMPLIAPVVVLEKQGATSAIRRAWELARRRFWWILGFMFILYLLNWAITAGPAYVITFALQTLLKEQASYGTQMMIQTVIQSLATLFAGLLYLPLQLSAVTLLYFDLRVRTEGFDLAILSRNGAAEESDTTALTSQAPAVTSPQLITTRELGYLALLSLGGIALFALVYGILMAIGLAASQAF